MFKYLIFFTVYSLCGAALRNDFYYYNITIAGKPVTANNSHVSIRKYPDKTELYIHDVDGDVVING